MRFQKLFSTFKCFQNNNKFWNTGVKISKFVVFLKVPQMCNKSIFANERSQHLASSFWWWKMFLRYLYWVMTNHLIKLPHRLKHGILRIEPYKENNLDAPLIGKKLLDNIFRHLYLKKCPHSLLFYFFRHSSMRSYMTDHRTPIAWRHRDMTLHGHHNHNHSHHRHHHHRHRSPPSPTVTTSSSDEREEVPMVRSGHHHLRRPNSRYGQYSQFSAAEAPFHARPAPYRSGGTLRWALVHNQEG